MFQKILIANRGEIVVRVAQTLQEMGIGVVCVYSEPDQNSVHASSGDEAYLLEGHTSAETYLRADKILDIARRCGADAIHPGYGFLSENADFCQACQQAGLVFIGPSPAAMRAVGNKVSAKKAAEQAGVPVVPGWSGASSEGSGSGGHSGGDSARTAVRGTLDEAMREARRIGYPVMIKAAAGGGGKGMRRVASEDELASSMEAAQREAASAFGNPAVFIEKYIARPRHVEFQIFGDTQGNVVHLFERECSIQRRHQKVMEESPSPAMSPELREQMGGAAVRLAKAIGYTNAGTVEFMLDEKGSFYFLEVNARLQVEHPVTEAVTHTDLVRAQVLVAAGESLPFQQESLRQSGHAVECRVYAEDPAHGFLPSIGTLATFRPPTGAHIRVDSGVTSGSEVSVYYDPMLAKLIVWSSTRPGALDRMAWALRRFAVLGVTTNLEFLQRLVQHPDVRAGRVHTHFLDETPILGTDRTAIPFEAWAAAALATTGSPRSTSRTPSGEDAQSVEPFGPWSSGGWRIGAA